MSPQAVKALYGAVILIGSGIWAYMLSVPTTPISATVAIAVMAPKPLENSFVTDVELQPDLRMLLLKLHPVGTESPALGKVSFLIAGSDDCRIAQPYPETVQQYAGSDAPSLLANHGPLVKVYQVATDGDIAALQCGWKGAAKTDYSGRSVVVEASPRYFSFGSYLSKSSDATLLQNFRVGVTNINNVQYLGGHSDAKIPSVQDLDQHDAATTMAWTDPNAERFRTFLLFLLAAVFAYGLTVILDDAPLWLAKKR